MNDITRQAPAKSDMGRCIPIKSVLLIFREAGLPRDIRSLQRYCENDPFDGIEELAATGATSFLTGEVVTN
jgi:hypothetical protein